MKALKSFLQDDQGQDLSEYAFLLGFVALASLSLLRGPGAGGSSLSGGPIRVLPLMIVIPALLSGLLWIVALAYRWVLWVSRQE